MPTKTAPAELPEVEAAKAAAVEAAAARAAAEKTAADLREALEKLRAEQLAAEAAAAEAAENERLAAQRIADAERRRQPDPIDGDTMRAIAERLVASFDAYDKSDSANRENAVTSLYRAIDDTTARLLTADVSDDARPILLATVGVLDSVVEWEQFRGLTDEQIDNRRRMLDLGNTADPRRDISPTDCGLVRTLLAELRGVLTGQATRQKPLESIGELLGQNVAPQQIAKMLGLFKADGSGDIAQLGFIIDRALAAAGYFREVAGVAHLSRIGALNREQAWTMFERSIDTRRERAWSRGQIGSVQDTGTYRTTRSTQPLTGPPSATIDGELDASLTPAFRRSLAQISERRRAERQAIVDAALDDIGDDADSSLDRF